MKVSIIVPVYNTERFLPDCLDSIIKQTETDFEVILVDDGSTDKSNDICVKYAMADNRFQVIHKENGGVSSARNCGIKKMRGDYFCFIDSDDIVSPDYISILLGNMQNNGCAMSVCCMTESKFMHQKNTYILNRKEATYSVFNEKNGIKGYIGGKMFKSEIVTSGNIRFDEKQTLAEDMLFIFDYLRACTDLDMVFVSDAKLYRYVKNEDSVLNRRNNARVFDEKWCNIAEASKKALDRTSLEEKKLRKAICMEMVMQYVTLLGIMIRCDEKNSPRYKEYRKFVAKYLFPYLCNRKFSLRKRIGALAMIICPDLASKKGVKS